MCVVYVHTPERITTNIYGAFQIFENKIFWNIIVFNNQIYWAQNDPFWESKVIVLKKVMIPISENVTKYWLSASPKRVFKHGC